MTIALGVLLPVTTASGINVNDTDAEPIWKTWTVITGGQLYPVQYSITGGRVVSMAADTSSTLTITISSSADGNLTIKLPRELVDSRAGDDGRSGVDDAFAVFVDDEYVESHETEATNTTRTLVVDFRRGAATIEIIGAWRPDLMFTKEWQTMNIVGRFLFNDPPKPDQIFKIQYRAINGTFESINARHGFGARINSISSGGDGMLQVLFPRNYPFTNSDADFNASNAVFFINDQIVELENATKVTDCFFEFSIPFSGNSGIGISWAYLATNLPFRGDSVSNDCILQTVKEGVPVRADGTITPLQQFKAGVAAEDVVCPERAGGPREQFILLISPYGKPYCVSPSNEGFMKARGWTEP